MKIRLAGFLLLLVVPMVPGPSHAVDLQPPYPSYRLYFPDHLALRRDEWIEEVHVDVACGHIEAVTAIPDDWALNIQSKVSEVERLHLGAGHGVSRIPDLKVLSGIIRIDAQSTDCFSVSASVVVSGPDKDRRITLRKADLKLVSR